MSFCSQSPNESTIHCNRCRKTLTTTLFVCSCDCVFCEECTYEHFGSNTDCPSCRKRLAASDFLELVVSDPSSAPQETLKSTFQHMFTKFSSKNAYVSRREMCARVLKSMDDDCRAMRFLMKQFVNETNAEGQRTGNLRVENENLKKEIIRIKQASNTERIKFEQAISDLNNRLQSMSSSIQGLQRQIQEQQGVIRERDTQIAQFREIVASESEARIPSSSHSSHSGGGRRGRLSSSATPPTQGIMQNRQSREIDRRKELQELTRNTHPIQPRISHPIPMSSIGITPVQIPRSSSGENVYPGASRGGLVSSSGRMIRDFTSSGYTFTGIRPGSGKNFASQQGNSGGISSFVRR